MRVRKQVSMCSRCKKKYDPITFSQEFGIAEFRCQQCNHEFYHWSSKDATSTCRKCHNTSCLPVKIMPHTYNRKLQENRHHANKHGSQYSSSNSSSSGGQGFASLIGGQEMVQTLNIANNNSSHSMYDGQTNLASSPGAYSNYAYSNNYRYWPTYRNYAQPAYATSIGPNYYYYCEQCKDTNINLNEGIVFRPKGESVHEYMSHGKTG